MVTRPHLKENLRKSSRTRLGNKISHHPEPKAATLTGGRQGNIQKMYLVHHRHPDQITHHDILFF